jgi:peptidoglycan/xylan/chitin deacetylase (PgdA/CDA1 family)
VTAAPYGAARTGRERRIAVAIHDVEPATFERCALIRDWLDDHGIDRATLLVIPAPDLHPFFQRRPDLAAWLLDCRDRGDAIAQHGLQHRPAKEFARLDADATHASIEAGRRVLTLAGVEPRGFVAPAYAYTPVLRRELACAFDWWATLLRLVGRERASLAPALSLRRSPLGVRAAALASGRLLRLDLHPADFDRPRHVLALESVLARAAKRIPVTYDDLC